MDFKPKNREWVKNAAIIFLAVLLVLTFFSNTWMNRSLPEVATQAVSDGTITAKVRGTGTVTAAGSHQVKAAETREIRAVMVKVGQEVSPGDVLFVLGQGEASELEQAQEKLRTLQISYQRTAASASPSASYASDDVRIQSAKEDMDRNYAKMVAIEEESKKDLPLDQRDAAQEKVKENQAELDQAKKALEEKTGAYNDLANRLNDYRYTYENMVSNAVSDLSQKDLDRKVANEAYETARSAYEADPTPENEQAMNEAKASWDAAEESFSTASTYRESLNSPDLPITQEMEALKVSLDAAKGEQDAAQASVDDCEAALKTAQEELDGWQKIIDEIMASSLEGDNYVQARDQYLSSRAYYIGLIEEKESKQAQEARNASLTGIELMDLAQQIELAKAKLDSLSGGEENQITAKVSGTVQSVECTAGDTKAKNEVLCTIEVPDMGHTLSFSVTNDQAKRLRVGDTGSVSNYYWGNQITATLTAIQTDPKSPQNNKLLTFDLEGDVNTGSELTISVGQKSASYDVIVPNSSIRSDSNGSFVLMVESRSSPLGNRDVARRVNVEVLAADDNNSAVTADLHYGDYVITTSSAPIKSGELVRLADA